MGSFDYLEYWREALAIAALLVLLFAWREWFCHFHVGFGVDLRMRTSDGTVWVCSRLLNYPAHEAGITNRQRVISIDGMPLRFAPEKEFKRWFKVSSPQLGVEQRWVVEECDGELVTQKIAVMKPVLVATSIPDYWSPNRSYPEIPLNDWRIRRGLAFCVKTGQLRFTYSLSNAALQGVYA
jgi:hypothetical protein